jgi:hypothetical protein
VARALEASGGHRLHVVDCDTTDRAAACRGWDDGSGRSLIRHDHCGSEMWLCGREMRRLFFTWSQRPSKQGNYFSNPTTGNLCGG